jgi:hypothetical protein
VLCEADSGRVESTMWSTNEIEVDEETAADLDEFFESQVRHRDFAVDGCECVKCAGHRERQNENEQHEKFVRMLGKIRRANESNTNLRRRG